MLTSESVLGTSIQDQSGVLSMLAQGFPISRTLEAAAVMAAQVESNVRCAILLVQDERLIIGASQDLTIEDRELLREVCSVDTSMSLANLNLQLAAEVRPLITHAAEWVGTLVVFGLNGMASDPRIARQLDEVCAIVTVAIEQRHLVEELTFRAHHDALTHLWNRVWIDEEMARALDSARETGLSTGFILIGIDSFRLINEVLGSHAGNLLLRETAARLLDAMEPGFMLARGGGDEFMVLMPNLSSPERVEVFASHLLTWFEKPFEIAGHELLIRASIGVTVAAPGTCEVTDLHTQSAIALRFAKKHARGHVSNFTAEMLTTPPERLAMEKHLRFALQKREFELYYQPQVLAGSGKLIGVEALLRWRHASLGFISPSSFVPIAEEIGIIDEIGDWALGEAIRQLAIWQDAGLTDLRVAVNVSALQFSKQDFAASVARRLRNSRVEPEYLELEITETAVMTNFEHGLRQFKLLRALGILTALDDFGTGHSSLAYLQQLPIQRLKIDRMFVKNIVKADERPPLLSGIIQMGHALGCSVIAEGVETPEQALAIAAMGCEEIQGYLFSRPIPADELLAWAQARAIPTYEI